MFNRRTFLSLAAGGITAPRLASAQRRPGRSGFTQMWGPTSRTTTSMSRARS